MGGVFYEYFLDWVTEIYGQDWISKYIGKWIAIHPANGGSAVALADMLRSGTYAMKNNVFHKTPQVRFDWPGFYHLFPRMELRKYKDRISDSTVFEEDLIAVLRQNVENVVEKKEKD